MTQQGFNDYLFTVFGYKNGTAKSYITAVHIIDEMFLCDDVFDLRGKSVTNIRDFELLKQIEDLFAFNNHYIGKKKILYFGMLVANKVVILEKGSVQQLLNNYSNIMLMIQKRRKHWQF